MLCLFLPRLAVYIRVGFMERGIVSYLALSLTAPPPSPLSLSRTLVGHAWKVLGSKKRGQTDDGMCEINVTNFNAAFTKRQRQKQYKSTTTTIIVTATTTIVTATAITTTLFSNNSNK